jgi:hypothetical protein
MFDCVLSANRAWGGSGGKGLEQRFYCPFPILSNFREPAESGGTGAGGAIYSDGSLSLYRCTLMNNSATGGEGGLGIYNSGGDPLNTVVEGGPGGNGFGGAIYFERSFYAQNCTFTGNGAVGGRGGRGDPGGNGGGGFGGAIFNASSGRAVINSCTISGNSADRGRGGCGPNDCYNGVGADGTERGGGIDALDAPEGTALGNTIIALNSIGFSGSHTVSDVAGVVVSFGFNWVGIKDRSVGWAATDVLGTFGTLKDPRLGPLQDNGGPTPTMALLPESGAIDRGNSLGSPNTDQRGFLRPVDLAGHPTYGDGSDIGAYERQPTAAPSPLTIHDGAGPLRIPIEADSLTSPLRFTYDGVVYGIVLVPPDSPNASRIRVQTSSGVKAVMKLP